MAHHLKTCKHVSSGVHTWAKQWIDKSEPYTGDGIEDTQSDLSKFMSLKDMPLTDEQQEVFHMMLLKATISANLPFAWIDNPFVKEAFTFLRSVVDLPSRRQLSGQYVHVEERQAEERHAEERQAVGFDMAAYKNCTATLKAPPGSIFAGAPPMLDDESVGAY